MARAEKKHFRFYPLLIFISIILGFSCISVGPPEVPQYIKCENGGFYHRVLCGDDLFKIARQYDFSAQHLAQLNKIKNPDRLEPGSYVYIPPKYKSTYTNKSNYKNKIIAQPVISNSEKIEYDPPPQNTNQPSHITSKKEFILPLNGKISRGFINSATKKHKGIDILAPQGTPIVAAKSGVVIYEGNSIPGYGNLIIIDHGKGLATLYGHHKKNLVRVNQNVRQGETIALVGMTGRATAPHLHFELRKNTVAIDPMPYLP